MRIEMKWGIILALAVAVWTLLIHLLGVYTFRIQYASIVDNAAIILPVAAIAFGLLELKRKLGGRLSVRRGVLFGLGVAVVSAPLTTAFLWFYHNYVNPEWLTYLVNYEQATLTAAGADAAEIGARVAQLQSSGTDGMQALGIMVGTLGTCLVLSLVITLAFGLQARLRQRGT